MSLQASPSLKNHHRARARGFTLIEVLVAVSIVLVLSALIVPAVKNGLRSSSQAKCIGNLRQIGVAATMYSNDNDGKVLVAFLDNENPTWADLLAPYMGVERTTTFQSATEMPVFTCPDNPKSFGYGLNYLYLGWPTQGINPSRLSIVNPSKTVLMTDSYKENSTGEFSSWEPYVRPPSLSWLHDSSVRFSHPGKTANVLWLDGHVTAETAQALMVDDSLWDTE